MGAEDIVAEIGHKNLQIQSFVGQLNKPKGLDFKGTIRLSEIKHVSVLTLSPDEVAKCAAAKALHLEKLSRLANPRFAEILQDPERTGNYLTAAVTDEIIAKLNLMRQPQAAAVFVENKRSETEETKRPFIAKVRTDQEQLQDSSDLFRICGYFFESISVAICTPGACPVTRDC